MRMRLIVLAVVLATLRSATVLAEGSELPDLSGEWKLEKLCSGRAVNVWGWSDHNGNGNNNERNIGIGARCYTGKRWFVQADYILENSQRRPTQDIVFGGEFQVLKIEKWKLLGAGSLGWVRYERPHKDPVKKWVAVPTVVLRYNDTVDLNFIPVNLLVQGERVQIFFITWHF